MPRIKMKTEPPGSRSRSIIARAPDGRVVARGSITLSRGAYHNVLRHLTPLVITQSRLDEALDALADSAPAPRAT